MKKNPLNRQLEQLISQDYPDLEVIVVNDRSTDNTGEILEKLKTQYPRLKVITIHDLPPNWLGKNHAVYQRSKRGYGRVVTFPPMPMLCSPLEV